MKPVTPSPDGGVKPLRYGMAKCLFFLMGLINNSGYTIVLSAASDIASETKNKSKMPMFSGSLVLMAIVIYLINSRFLINFKHTTRIIAASCFFFLGVTCIITSLLLKSFPLALGGSLVLGIGTTLGGSTVMGFLKTFDAQVVFGWASGTGFAGIFGAGYYLTLKAVGASVMISLVSLLPMYVIYILVFFRLNKIGRTHENATIEAEEGNTESIVHADDYLSSQAPPSMSVASPPQKPKNVTIGFSNICQLYRLIVYYTLSLAIVYFCEYSCIGYLAHVLVRHKSSNSIHRFSFEIIQACYQIGVFIGRSSLAVLRIKKVWLLTFAQLLLFASWLTWALWFERINFWILYVSIFFVGIVGGMSYANVIFSIVGHPKIEKEKKEACLNLNGASYETAVLLNSVIGVLFENVIRPFRA